VVQWLRERTAPILTAFKQWLDDLLPGTAPQSALGKAIAYSVRQWPKLVLHHEHGDVPIHNNATENEIRPFSQGRRVWLFAHNPMGARASANLFTLVSSARANGLEPYRYLNYICLNHALRQSDTVDPKQAGDDGMGAQHGGRAVRRDPASARRRPWFARIARALNCSRDTDLRTALPEPWRVRHASGTTRLP